MNNLDIIKVRMEALGWMYAYACNALDKGEDIRQIEVPELLEAFHKDHDSELYVRIMADKMGRE